MTLESLFEDFKQRKIIVLGDVMIDAYIKGIVQRVSPEAPVPIVNLTKKESRLGGAANVALNLKELGADVTVATVIGADEEAEELKQLFKENTILTKGIIQSGNRQTTIKTRILGNHQQLLRIDQEDIQDINTDEENQLLAIIEKLLEDHYDALVFQDYNKGVLTENVILKTIQLCNKHNVITTVDPKHKNFLTYKNVTLFKPNLKELNDGLQTKINFKIQRKSFESAVSKLKYIIEPDILFVTLSEHGVFIQNEKEKYHISANKRKIFDVSGAGDTVISVATLCLCAGLEIKTIAEISNLAGGIVCEYKGVVAINAAQLLTEAKKLNIICG